MGPLDFLAPREAALVRAAADLLLALPVNTLRPGERGAYDRLESALAPYAVERQARENWADTPASQAGYACPALEPGAYREVLRGYGLGYVAAPPNGYRAVCVTPGGDVVRGTINWWSPAEAVRHARELARENAAEAAAEKRRAA